MANENNKSGIYGVELDPKEPLPIEFIDRLITLMEKDLGIERATYLRKLLLDVNKPSDGYRAK